MAEKRSRPGQSGFSHGEDRAGGNPSRCGGQRAWRREVNRMTDAELIRCVRAQVAVDHAVNTRRKNGETVFIPPTQTPT
jgi:hypothetical protein